MSRKGASDARQFSPTLSLGLGGTFLNEEKMDENVYNNSWWCWLSYSSPASSIYTLILIDSQIMILYSSKSFKSNKFFLEFYTMSNRHILWIWWAFCFFLVHKSKPKSFTFFNCMVFYYHVTIIIDMESFKICTYIYICCINK